MLDGSPAAAQSVTEHHARARLIAESTALVRGKAAFIGLTFDIDPGWHIYWHGASDSGMPITFEFEAVPGVSIGKALWPAPKRHVSPGEILDYVYEKRVTLLVPVTLSDSAPATDERLTLKASVSWMVCKDVCLLEEARLSITLTVQADGAKPVATPDASLFDEARRTIPRDLDKSRPRFTTRWEGRTLRIEAAGAAEMFFYAGAESVLKRPIRDGEARGAAMTLEFEDAQKNDEVTGVLEIRRAGGAASEYYTVRVPLGGTLEIAKPNKSPKG